MRCPRTVQTAAHLVDHAIPHVPVRQWVLSLPIPLRLLLAAQPKLVTSVLQVVHSAITSFLVGQAGLKADEEDSGTVTLIQRFGSPTWKRSFPLARQTSKWVGRTAYPDPSPTTAIRVLWHETS